MAQSLPGSKHGEGIGGTCQEVADANNPSFDPASRLTGTDKKIAWLLALPSGTMSQWEMNFVMDIYGSDKLTKTQHMKVWKIANRCGWAGS